jgi:hypothetical protein
VFPENEAKDEFVAITNQAFNDELMLGTPIPFRLSSNKTAHCFYHENNPQTLTLMKWVVYNSNQNDLAIFNTRKIRVANEVAAGKEILLEPTDYVSSAMTDSLAFNEVTSTEHLGGNETDVLYDGVSAFSDKKSNAEWHLLSYAENKCANQLAISTIAFSSDGFLLTIKQSSRNMINAGKILPSCSGSLDWDDLKGSKSGDLKDILKFGAERELREECALLSSWFPRQKKIGCIVKVFAFVRLVERSGKPEFFAVGRIDAPADLILSRRHRRVERQYTEAIIPYHRRRIVQGIEAIHVQIGDICNEYLENKDKDKDKDKVDCDWTISSQLRLGLLLLSKACEQEVFGRIVDEFFYRSLDTAR